jgi:D-ala-D-ala dipeptidase
MSLSEVALGSITAAADMARIQLYMLLGSATGLIVTLTKVVLLGEFFLLLLLLPVVAGYFMATVFAPLVLILALILTPFIVVSLPGFLMFSAWRRGRVGLNNPQVLNVVVDDMREPLVNFSNRFPQFFSEEVLGAGFENMLGRREIGDLLVQAQTNLGTSFRLRLVKCYDTSRLHPVDALTCQNEIMSHNSGAAIDITLVDQQGNSLDMGSFGWQSKDASGETDRLESGGVSIAVQRNRNLMARVLTEAGFVNNPSQWWHWSFGDQFWAYLKNNRNAIFGAI